MPDLIKVNKVSEDIELVVTSVYGNAVPTDKLKDINFIMGLPFKVEITPIPEKEGGGFSSKLLGVGLSVIGDGDTIGEAVQDMRSYQKEWLNFYINQNGVFEGNKNVFRAITKKE